MKKEKKSTRDLIGINEIGEYSVRTNFAEYVFFLIKPSNLSVMSDTAVEVKIHSLMTILKTIPEMQMICLNSKENFDDNKRYIKKRTDEEINPVIRKLLELDSKNLDKIQATMATAREFIIAIKIKSEKENDILPYLSRIEKSFKDSGFITKRADKDDIKRILSVYFEQNVTTEKYEDFDGERWVI